MTSLDDRALRGLHEWARGPGPGDVLDARYELGRRLGEGGMGVVYSAEDRLTKRRVAVKVVRGGGSDDTARFEREVRSLQKIDHPAIVKCLAHGVHEGSRYLVMDQLDGCSLAERLAKGRLSVREVVVLGAASRRHSPRCIARASCIVTSSRRTSSSSARPAMRA